jgi:hypothetical protein
MPFWTLKNTHDFYTHVEVMIGKCYEVDDDDYAAADDDVAYIDDDDDFIITLLNQSTVQVTYCNLNCLSCKLNGT